MHHKYFFLVPQGRGARYHKYLTNKANYFMLDFPNYRHDIVFHFQYRKHSFIETLTKINILTLQNAIMFYFLIFFFYCLDSSNLNYDCTWKKTQVNL